MSKYLVSIVATAAALACGSASAAIFEEFTVNETVIPGANVFSLANATLKAGKLNGSYTEALTVTGPGTFAASAFANFSQFLDTNGGATVTSLLNSFDPIGGYRIYAVFSASGSITGPNTFASNNNAFDLYLDPGSDTTGSVTNGTLPAVLALNGEDILLASAGAALFSSAGTGNLNGPPGAFNIDFTDFTLTAFGKTVFVAPDPFFLNVRVNGDYDGVNPTADPVTRFITGDVSANFAVPEPGSLALVGLALMGAGVASRRSASKKK
jgi:hypothetical protein